MDGPREGVAAVSEEHPAAVPEFFLQRLCAAGGLRM
jgi:hypothetical protein